MLYYNEYQPKLFPLNENSIDCLASKRYSINNHVNRIMKML